MNPDNNDIMYTPHVPESHSDYRALAYVKPIQTDRGKGYAVCSADGTQLAIFASSDVAMFAARQHDLEPTLIH